MPLIVYMEQFSVFSELPSEYKNSSHISKNTAFLDFRQTRKVYHLL